MLGKLCLDWQNIVKKKYILFTFKNFWIRMARSNNIKTFVTGAPWQLWVFIRLLRDYAFCRYFPFLLCLQCVHRPLCSPMFIQLRWFLSARPMTYLLTYSPGKANIPTSTSWKTNLRTFCCFSPSSVYTRTNKSIQKTMTTRHPYISLNKYWNILLADPGEARHCSTDSIVIEWVSQA